MSNCCAVPGKGPEAGKAQLCPACGRKGHRVETITLKALLRPDALARLEDVAYSFCSTPVCPVAYFANEVGSIFRKEELKVRVGLKEKDDPLLVCYCFGHTRAGAWEEIRQTGKSTVVASIAAHVKAGRCACEVNNPSGRCCLGEVRKVVKEGLARFGGQAAETAAVAVEDCCADRDATGAQWASDEVAAIAVGDCCAGSSTGTRVPAAVRS